MHTTVTPSQTVHIHPARLRNFGDPAGCTFMVLTTPDLALSIHVDGAGSAYGAHLTRIACNLTTAWHEIEAAPERSHILVVMPGVYFQSPPTAVLGVRKKLAVLASFSTPTEVRHLAHFLRVAENTDAHAQERFAEHLFAVGPTTPYLALSNDEYGTRALFQHLDDSLTWHEQIGTLDWGQQQLLPSGEISVLPSDILGQDITRALDVTGDIALQGMPILHAGGEAPDRAEQARLFAKLWTLTFAPVRMSLDHGRVLSVTPLAAAARPAAECLEQLFAADARYSLLLEMGFGCNFSHDLLPSNSAMNEVHGGHAGVMHIGFGLVPHTPYHLDILCPQTRVQSASGQDILGPRAKRRAV